MFSKMLRTFCIVPFMLSYGPARGADWTLESSVSQAMSVAPELRKAMAEIGSRQADIRLSTLWPDPSVELRVDNKLGQDDGSGGYDLTDVTLSQPIPLSRIGYQKSVAEAQLKVAEFSRGEQALALQNRVAKVFHRLQFASAQLSLAEKRLQLADELGRPTRRNAQGIVVRYLTALEKMRLGIIREEAHQAVTNAEGRYHEALSEFAKLLGLDMEAVGTLPQLQAIDRLPDLQQLFDMQQQHPRLSAQQQQLLAARHSIDVARASQTSDPTISLSRSRETFNGGRDDVYGIMLNVQIPVHDRKQTAVTRATYQASQQRIELGRIKREMQINLKRSYTHLGHLVEQAADYERKVLDPARRMLDLSKRGFSSGELNVLSLVDANNTYFAARARYLELIYQSRMELADVRLYAGRALNVLPVNTESVGSVSMIEGGR